MKKKTRFAALAALLLAFGLFIPSVAFAGEKMPNYSAGDDESSIYFVISDNYGYQIFDAYEPYERSHYHGMWYDQDTNVLTMENVNLNHSLQLRRMGENLIINVIGSNSIGNIEVLSGTWGGSLSIMGDGDLTINKYGDYKNGILIEGGYYDSENDVPHLTSEEAYLYIGEDVNLTVYSGADSGGNDAITLYTGWSSMSDAMFWSGTMSPYTSGGGSGFQTPEGFMYRWNTTSSPIIHNRIKKDQSISASNISKTFGDGSFALGATRTVGDGALAYKSSNENVATVASNGLVTLKGAGTTTITVSAAETSHYKAATKNVTVSVAKATQAIEATGATKDFGAAPFALGARLTQGDGALTYESSNTNVAKVSASGVVTIVGAGTANITIKASETSNYKAASKVVAVKVNKVAQSINAKNVSKTYGAASFALGAKLAKGNGKLTYASSNAKVAKVASNGKVAIKGAGKATITISAAETGNYTKASKTVTITVKKAANKMTAKGKTVSLNGTKLQKGAQTVKKAKAFVVKKASGKVTFKKVSGNKKITVSKKGVITAKKGLAAGTYKVKVKVTAAGNKNYKAVSKNVVVKVKVSKPKVLKSASVGSSAEGSGSLMAAGF